jgi:integrase
MVTGVRGGELLALRWRHVDLDAAMLTVRRNYVRAAGVGHDKDTKTHQMRRLSIGMESRVTGREPATILFEAPCVPGKAGGMRPVLPGRRRGPDGVGDEGQR